MDTPQKLDSKHSRMQMIASSDEEEPAARIQQVSITADEFSKNHYNTQPASSSPSVKKLQLNTPASQKLRSELEESFSYIQPYCP